MFTKKKPQGAELLGLTVEDKITGYKGTATGFVQYITGCNQILVAPPANGIHEDAGSPLVR